MAGIWGLKPLISLVSLLALPALAYAQDDATDHFVLTITTTEGTNSADQSFTFYTQDTSYDIDWNNDQIFASVDTGVAGDQSHTFNTAGEHTIRFRNLNDININKQPDRAKYTSIEQWGTAVWNAEMNNAFYGASNLVGNYTDTPDMSAVTTMRNMFREASLFNSDISGWNTENVTNMRSIFNVASSFNQDIGSWNTENVTIMSYVFHKATVFNQDIGNWNTGNVTTMFKMFEVAEAFNQDIGRWNTGNVTNMEGMFRIAEAFNQDIGDWNVANVTTMHEMFFRAIVFNQDIGNWNVENVTIMSYVFINARVFDGDIGSWNVENVTTMERMFAGASVFNQDIGSWNVANVTDMSYVFSDARAFNQDIGSWNVENVTTMKGMFHFALVFNQDIGNWNTGNVTDMIFMFRRAKSFNQDIGNWNVENVTTMSNMFYRASVFNQDIGRWNTARVTDMSYMFSGATSFDQNIGGWNVEAVTNMRNMFKGNPFSPENSTLSPTNYDALLTGWNAQNLQTGVLFHGGNSKYSSDAAHTARENMVNTTANGGNNWTIGDGRRVQAGDAPTNIFLSSTSISENAGANVAVGTLSTNGGASSYTYTLVAGTGATDNSSFNISSTALQLVASADYETKTTYAVRLKVDGVAVEKQFTIAVTDVNDPPVFTSGTAVSVAEGMTEVTTVTATDADVGQTVTFTLSGGADASKFSLTSAGALTFTNAPDYEMPTDADMDNNYEVEITATDGQTSPLTATQTLTVTVTDMANEHAPVFTSGTAVSVAEGMTEVTTVTATDTDGDEVTFTLSGGADASKFSLTPAGALTFTNAPDYEMPTDVGMDNNYEVEITATDGQTSPLTATQTITVTVTNIEDGDALGTDNLEIQDIIVYPNPVGAVLHISGVAGNARYSLSGIDGKVLKRGKLKAGTADHSVAIPSLKKGIYLLQLTTDKGSVTRKIVKE